MSTADVREAGSALRGDLQELARRTVLLSLRYALLAQENGGLPDQVSAGSVRFRAAVDDLLRAYHVAPGEHAPRGPAPAVRTTYRGSGAAVDAVEESLARALQALEAVLRHTADADTRATCRSLYADLLRQERRLRGWAAPPARPGPRLG